MTKKQLAVYAAVAIVVVPISATAVAGLSAIRHISKLRKQVAADKERDRNKTVIDWWTW